MTVGTCENSFPTSVKTKGGGARGGARIWSNSKPFETLILFIFATCFDIMFTTFTYGPQVMSETHGSAGRWAEPILVF